VKFKDGDLTEEKIKKKMRYNLVLNDRDFMNLNLINQKI
jgi:hypothetical protein